MYADDLAIGLSYKYSNEYVGYWKKAYLDGRESYEDFVSIRDYVMELVGLTFQPGIVMVQSHGSIKPIHVDNLKLTCAE